MGERRQTSRQQQAVIEKQTAELNCPRWRHRSRGLVFRPIDAGDREPAEIGERFRHEHERGRVVRVEHQSPRRDPGGAPHAMGKNRGLRRSRAKPADQVQQRDDLEGGVGAGLGGVERETWIERGERGGEKRRTGKSRQTSRGGIRQ